MKLLAKSISRNTIEEIVINGGEIRNEKIVLAITIGSKYINYSNTEWNLIKTAINNYSEYANKEVLNNEIAANVCIDAGCVVKKICEKCFRTA
ncbi:MAG: hypothetical protein SPF57_01695 [Streptococcus orisratti]|uniref:hypothetical protein n=1 Tax=Streptococcus orisratti TaxID=114652 RepID=UPI002A91D7CC|nr:hypothetical protein [Streptococcus orisratti]MDY5635067.1 hypothetical protein [Streptococcus orisratti]